MALDRRDTAGRGHSSPLWMAVTYFIGLLLLYAGQRVVIEWEQLALGLTVLGVCAVVGATALRFVQGVRAAREHARVAVMLGSLQSLGLLALGLYFASSGSLIERLSSDTETQTALRDVVSVVWVSTLALSALALAFAEVALFPMRHAVHLESRRVAAAALSGAVLGLGLGYGSLFVYTASKAEAQADFSFFKTSEPGEATVKLVQKLPDPVKVTAFFPEVSEVRAEVRGYLSELKRRAGANLEYELVDRYLQPKLAKEHRVVSDGSIVLARGDKQQKLNVGTEIDKARSKLKTLDKDFNAELLQLVRSKRVAYLTVGHGEINEEGSAAQRAEGRSAEILKQLLEHQNYQVKDLGLNQGLASAVPDDATIVLVLGPLRSFAPEEIATLRRYADGGGKVLMALDSDGVSTDETVVDAPTPTSDAPPAAGDIPVKGEAAKGDDAAKAQPAPADTKKAVGDPAWLRELASSLGVEYEPNLVADEKRFVPRRNNPSDHTLLVTNRFSSHASVSTLSRNSARAAVVLSGSGHLKKADGKAGADDAVKFEPTVRSFESAFVDLDGNFSHGPGEPSSSYNLGAAVSRAVAAPAVQPKSDEPKPDAKAKGETDASHTQEEIDKQEMRAFLLGDADVLSDLFMSRFPGNQMLALDAIRWLGGEESLAGEIESMEDVRIEPTKQEDVTWFYSTIFGVPLGVLGLGLLVSRSARKGSGKARFRGATNKKTNQSKPASQPNQPDKAQTDEAQTNQAQTNEEGEV